jgi:hypothetical protein
MIRSPLAFLPALLPTLALLAGHAGPARPVAAQKGSINFATMRRDLEVMRRILNRELRGTRDATSHDAARTGDQALFWALSDHQGSSWSGSSEAFYVPGDGALFLLRTSLELLPGAEASEEASSKEPTLWDEVREEVERGSSSRLRVGSSRGSQYDAKSVEKLKDDILGALANYGANIGQLGDDQHITVVVRGGGRSRYASLDGGYGTSEAKAAIERELPNTSLVMAWGSEASVMTIRVARADVAAKPDFETFKHRARIAQY